MPSLASPSLAGRAAAAVLLMAGFYLLALAVVAGLVAIPIVEYRMTDHVLGRVAIFCALGAFAILRAIVPRPDRFEPPGPTLRPEEHPRLFDAIEAVARDTGQAMPAEVFLVPDVNAWVAQRGGVMGFGSRRVMGLGLPLLQTVSVDELRAILAHEFGHYHGGDTALGPWIYKTRAAIVRTLQNLSRHSGLLMKPFEWYGLGFLRVTHAISRRQEYAADALAARVVGAAPLASGLRTIHGMAGAFVPYWLGEVAPLLERGYRPPIATGFTRFAASPLVAPQIAESIERELAEGKADPYDTHPALRDRLAALGGTAAVGARVATGEGPRAIELLEHVPEMEARLVEHLARGERGARGKRTAPLKPIAWDEAGPAVWAAIWRERTRLAGARLTGVTPAQVPALAADLAGVAVRFGFAPNRDAALEGDAGANVIQLLGGACTIALLDRGWTVSALPGDVVTLSDGATTMTPFADVMDLASGALPFETWNDRWRAIGMLEVELRMKDKG